MKKMRKLQVINILDGDKFGKKKLLFIVKSVYFLEYYCRLLHEVSKMYK